MALKGRQTTGEIQDDVTCHAEKAGRTVKTESERELKGFVLTTIANDGTQTTLNESRHISFSMGPAVCQEEHRASTACIGPLPPCPNYDSSQDTM